MGGDLRAAVRGAQALMSRVGEEWRALRSTRPIGSIELFRDDIHAGSGGIPSRLA
jgi:hypothetical protein